MPRGVIKSIEESSKPGQWSVEFESGRYCWIDSKIKEALEAAFDYPIGEAIRYHLNNKLFMILFQKGY